MSAICGAKARTNNYQPCRQPAMKNRRCRLQGGKSTGAKTEEGRWRIKKANMKHGFYCADELAEIRAHRAFMKPLKSNCKIN